VIKIVRGVELTRGLLALVYEESFAVLSLRLWHAHWNGYKFYAVTMIDRKPIYMHRFLLNFPPEVDHINGDGLDNRISNLRECDRSQNAANRECVGAFYRRGRWQAQVNHAGRNYQKSFSTKEEANAWRQQKKQELFHEFSGNEKT
jgi:hypothetical protein